MNKENFFTKKGLLVFYSNWNSCLALVPEKSFAKKILNTFCFIKDNKFITDSSKEFMDTIEYKGKKINLLYLQSVFLLAKAQWELECPNIPFPNIVIKDDDNISSGALQEFHTLNNKEYYPEIILNINLVYSQNSEKILWVIGHELGHLYFRKNKIKPKIIFDKKINMFPGAINIFFFINLISLSFLLYPDYRYYGIVAYVYFLVFSFQSFYGLKKRFNEYAEEFFCDIFSELITQKSYLKGFTYSMINFDTHPSDISRIKNLKNNKIKNIQGLHLSVEKNGFKINLFDNFLRLF